jgi:hypothetical protein
MFQSYLTAVCQGPPETFQHMSLWEDDNKITQDNDSNLAIFEDGEEGEEEDDDDEE